MGKQRLTLSGSLPNTRYGLIVNGGIVNLNKTGVVAVANNPLVLNSGTVRITGTGGNQINNADNLQVDGGTFDLNGFNEAVGGLNAAAAGGVVLNDSASGATLFVGGSSAGTANGDFAGVIQNGIGTVALTKEPGSSATGGRNSYTGVTNVAGGVLQVDGSITGTSQVQVANGATLRGTGTVKSPDWNIHGTVQAGGAAPMVADHLTLDLSGSSGTPMQFQSDSTARFALGSAHAASTINVLGSALGTVTFSNNTFDFLDLTAGSLAAGAYTLFDGNATATYNLGGSLLLTGLRAYPGSAVSVSGNDIVLTLPGGGGVLGDYNSNGTVDAADYVVWRNAGPTDVLPNDPTSGTVDQSDYDFWRSRFGATSGSGSVAQASSAAVPEPASLFLTFIGATAVASRRRNRKR